MEHSFATALLEEAQQAAEAVLPLRRMIHRHPELGNEEVQTSEIIKKTLADWGWHVCSPMGTSVVALLSGAHPGKTVAFRADMDALPITEETGLPFASTVPGKMHACGHDMHVAGLLGAAKIWADHRSEISGNIKLLFQPDEEGNGGALRMIQAHCLENPHVDAVFGTHVDPDLPCGTVGIRYGKAYAASDMFTIMIKGCACHGASPEQGIDAIAIASQVITALQQIVSRRISPTDSAVVTIGSIHAGTASNIIAQSAELKGIIRTLGPEMRKKVRDLLKQTVEGICNAMGAQVTISIKESYPGIVNHDAQVDLTARVARDLFGTGAVVELQAPTMGTEDFGYFLQKCPGAFYRIGVRNDSLHANMPLHSPYFIADESALSSLIALHSGIAMEFLNH